MAISILDLGVYSYLLIFAASFIISNLSAKLLAPKLKAAGITGKDVNKPGMPEVAEMGGMAVVIGFSAGILLAIALNTFNGMEFNILYILAGLITIHALAFVGIIDDLLSIPQWAKALMPLFAAVPLIAVTAAGSTEMGIPFVGTIDFGAFYVLVLIPIGVAVASNLTNMLAGFNGMEAGMGSAIFLFMAMLAWSQGNTEMLVFYLPMLGALLGFLPLNWYPAKVFPGDVGTLTIGAALATGVIIGNMESAGALILSLFVLDFFIKLANGFPSSKWWGEAKGGKLYPVEGKVRGLCQLVMKLFNGISERSLVLLMIFAQTLVGLFVLILFCRP
ncbi:MAG: hypothetical protein QXH30_00545 [Candidatus Bilamarchaeaceae archaeon]